jgi:hypothetical protein
MNPTLLVILIKQLTQFNIEYLIVGGVARILYNEKNYTKDIDLLIRHSEKNYNNLAKLLKTLQFDLNKTAFANTGIVRIASKQGTIEFLSKLDGVNAEEAFLTKNIILYRGISLHVISPDNLNKVSLAVKEKYYGIVQR